MGLPPELLGYAENIWRRFPEIFISLGSPDFEEYFEPKDTGVWVHSIVDTVSEKVIEIVLPRRGSIVACPCEEQATKEESFRSDEGTEYDDDFDEGNTNLSLDSPASSVNTAEASLQKDVTRPFSMRGQPNHLCYTMPALENVAHTLPVQESGYQQPLVASVLVGRCSNNYECTEPTTRAVEEGVHDDARFGRVSTVPFLDGRSQPPPISLLDFHSRTPIARPLAGSELARRRGFSISEVDTLNLRRPGCVMRVAEGPSSPEVSPGAHIQQAANRRGMVYQASGFSSPGEPLLPPSLAGLPQPFAGFSPSHASNCSLDRECYTESPDGSPGTRIQQAARCAQPRQGRLQFPLEAARPPLLLADPPALREHAEYAGVGRQFSDDRFSHDTNQGSGEDMRRLRTSFLSVSQGRGGYSLESNSPCLSLTESSSSTGMPFVGPLFSSGGEEERGSPRRRR